MQELTKAQGELYYWIKDFVEQHEYFPTIRAMMKAMGLRSPAPIQSRLNCLEKKGWIKKQEHGEIKLTPGMPGRAVYIRGEIIELVEKQISDSCMLEAWINDLLLRELAET